MTPLLIASAYRIITSDFLVYIDSDMWFLESDEGILNRFKISCKDVFITPHFYIGDSDYSWISGKYCVQYIVFKSLTAREILDDWAKNCKEECTIDSREGGKGDQRYLTFWDKDYPNRVYIAENFGEFIAPWNVSRDGIQNCVVYHFQGYRLLGNNFFLSNQSFHVPRLLLNGLYRPYTEKVKFYYNILFYVS
jgi:hypothetical protein